MTPELRTHYGAPKDAGVLVAGVETESPAAKAGIQVGDIVTRADGERIESGRDLTRAVRRMKPGETLKVEVSRDRAVKQLTVKIEERRSAESDLGDMGHDLGDLGPQPGEVRREDGRRDDGPGSRRAWVFSHPESLDHMRKLEAMEKRLQDLEKKLPRGNGRNAPRLHPLAGHDLGLDDVLRLRGRVGLGRLCAGHEKDRRRPGRNEVETRHELHKERRQKCPVPSDEPDHREGHHEVEHVVKRGPRPVRTEHHDLNDIAATAGASRSNASRHNCQAQLGYLEDLPSPPAKQNDGLPGNRRRSHADGSEALVAVFVQQSPSTVFRASVPTVHNRVWVLMNDRKTGQAARF
jgi:hypothetical protein